MQVSGFELINPLMLDYGVNTIGIVELALMKLSYGIRIESLSAIFRKEY